MVLDANQTRIQFLIFAFQQQNQLTVKNLSRRHILYFLAIECQDLAESGVMDCFVAIWYQGVKLVAYNFLLGNVEHTTESTAYRINHQPEVNLIAVRVFFRVKSFDGLHVSFLEIFDNCSHYICF